MIIRVLDAVAGAVGDRRVAAATDDRRITEAVEAAGYRAVTTSPDCATGSDRVSEAASRLGLTGTVVNVQGDEPLVRPRDVLRVINHHVRMGADATNAYSPLGPGDDPSNQNIPKVATSQGRLIYLSRAAIPGSKPQGPAADPTRPPRYKQVCIYAFGAQTLFTHYGPAAARGSLEATEDIELLRLLEHGVEVSMIELEAGTHAVDVPADITVVESLLS